MTSRMPVPEPCLETARLVLRIPGVEDFAGWARTQGDAEVMRYLGGPAPAIGAWKHMLAVVGSWHVQGFGCFSVIDKASGRWLGLAGPVRHAGWPGNEIGWTFAPEAWGHGYATEAAEAATAWAFGSLGWDAVIHCIDPDNAPSQAVARRLGSRNQGPVRLPPPYDARRIDLWGQTRAQWEERHPAPQQGRA
jgi:RimJ/RimL family protein N-acetyltransferase